MLKQHDKEFKHLPPRPWTYIGSAREIFQACQGAPIQAGGSCDHCATGIIDTHKFKAANGETFKVGSTCVDKLILIAGENQALAKAQRKIKNARNAAARERNKAKRKKAYSDANEAIDANRDTLENSPHPKGFNNLTLLDWATWMLKNGGLPAYKQVIKAIEGIK